MKRLTPLPIVLLLSLTGFAQYADQGIGNLRTQVWWFDWAGFTVKEGASRTFTTDDGLVVTVKFTDVSAHTPVPYPMNTWFGSMLYLMYDFSNPAIMPALYDPQSSRDRLRRRVPEGDGHSHSLNRSSSSAETVIR
ncbi:MAG TPA: CshA/CshB family fibrillar adhesin-related protein [Puia sp.]|nr:CshA/CshB family fibrillar adhesin-related protein [Puia sp.]